MTDPYAQPASPEIFRDSLGDVYARFTRSGHLETWPLRSRNYTSWLRQAMQGSGQRPYRGAVDDRIDELEAEAHLDGAVADTFRRVAGVDSNLYLDLANDAWEAVAISASGWNVVSDPPVRFIRTAQTKALPRPIRGGRVSDLRPLLNLESEDDWVLVVGWLVACLRPEGPYPLLALSGEQGSAKSTTTRLLRAIVDPNASPIRTLPRNEEDLFISARGSWVLAFDNLSGISWQMSDALSRLATGGGIAKRRLYSDIDEIVLRAMRPIILNGIGSVVNRGDLVDRAIVLELPPVNSGGRLVESVLWERAGSILPGVLGGLLDAASAGLRNLATMPEKGWSRMADFERWVSAAEPAFGWEPGTFSRAYAANRRRDRVTNVEDSFLGAVILELMEGRESWTGTAAELQGLAQEAARLPIDQARVPRTPKAASNELARLAPDLRALGLNVERARASGGSRTRLKTISRVPLPENGTAWDDRDDRDDQDQDSAW